VSKSTPLPHPGRGASPAAMEAYVASLPRDLDGDPYGVSEWIGPWKLSHCCGASAKGVDSPPYIVCRSCYDGFDSIDGPAALSPEWWGEYIASAPNVTEAERREAQAENARVDSALLNAARHALISEKVKEKWG
jgi:hypothetical protein